MIEICQLLLIFLTLGLIGHVLRSQSPTAWTVSDVSMGAVYPIGVMPNGVREFSPVVVAIQNSPWQNSCHAEQLKLRWLPYFGTGVDSKVEYLRWPHAPSLS